MMGMRDFISWWLGSVANSVLLVVLGNLIGTFASYFLRRTEE